MQGRETKSRGVFHSKEKELVLCHSVILVIYETRYQQVSCVVPEEKSSLVFFLQRKKISEQIKFVLSFKNVFEEKSRDRGCRKKCSEKMTFFKHAFELKKCRR